MPRIPRVTAISSGTSVPGAAFTSWLERLREANVDAVQIREKSVDDRVLLALVVEAVRVMTDGPLVIVNGRADVAIAAGADCVHLPGAGLPPASVRRLIGDHRVLGCSTHSLAEITRARDAGADYVYFSPIYDTPGKGKPVGLEELARASTLGISVIALGGITIDRLTELAAAGAVGIAGIRMFSPPNDLQQLTRAAARHFDSA